MTDLIINTRGPRPNIEKLVAEINAISEVENVAVIGIEPVPRNVLDRSPQKQIELIELAIAVVVNIASSAAYEKIKSLIQKRAEGLGHEVTKIEDKEQDDKTSK